MRDPTYTAAGGVVADGDKVLVLRRARLDQVRLPKGHIEDGESAEIAALREVAEESGFLDLGVVADLGTQVVVFRAGGTGTTVRRTERYFLMRLTGDARGPGEWEFEPSWVTWDEAERSLTFEAEREWVRRARAATDATLT